MTAPPVDAPVAPQTASLQPPSNSPDATGVDWLAEFPPPRSLRLDQEALRLYEHAYAVGLKAEKEGTPPITFTTVLAALFVGEDETSHWFAITAEGNGPTPSGVFAEKGLSQSEVQKLRPRPGKPQRIQLATDRHLLTGSARTVIVNAERWAQLVGASDIGVRHLVAAYVLNPPSAHGQQMQQWKYQEGKWRSVFFAWMAGRYTAEQWIDASQRPAPAKAVADIEQQKVKGEALAFPGDERTLEILEKAATFHARRTDPWLRLQTVFYALVEKAREDAAFQKTIQPVWNAVMASGPKYLKARDDFVPAQANPATPALSFSALDISPRVLNALETARDLALANRHGVIADTRVSALHLAGAIASPRVDGDVELAAMGLKPQELRGALVQYAQQRGESAEVWREVLGEEETVRAGRPVDLNSDEPEAVIRLDKTWTTDPLGIRRDVETFAALLASNTLEPPLSIGLFGPWGSGKTTFLKRLRQSVQHLTEEAKKTPGVPQSPYVSNVVHVDFNAWHFAESALISSLVDTIFRALNSYIKDDRRIAGKEWKQQKLEVLESTKRKVAAAQAVQAAASTAVSTAETDLTKRLQDAAQAATRLAEVAQRVWTATRSALKNSKVVKESGVLEILGDTIATTEELRTRVNALRTRPARMLGDLGWGPSLFFAAIVLGVPPLVGWLVSRITSTNQFTNLLSAATATLTLVGLWARAATGAVSKVDRAVTEVADAYAQRIGSDPAVVEAQGKLTAAQATAATAASDLQAAREQLARARADVANATLPAQMLQLVSSRIDTQSYSKELTTFSLARADLEALTVLLRDQGEESRTVGAVRDERGTTGQPAQRAVDRVILYIDDLDRCKPEDVVRVLQMVHMLLAFELFVVVVAVDARWVEEALRQSYKWLGEGEGIARPSVPANGKRFEDLNVQVTPQDYLEKIFQIAFWLEPMSSNRAASYLGSLVPAASREQGPVMGSNLTTVPQSGTTGPATKIGIAGIELDYMRALAAYIGSSPRRVKRLVNAYRLIKAGMSDAQHRTFLTDRKTDDGGVRSGPYQIVIGLLVIGTGAPGTSAQILSVLSEWDPAAGLDDVIVYLRARNDREWTMAARVLETVLRTQKAKSVAEIRGWARKVGRFLLNRPTADGSSAALGPPNAPQQPQGKS